MKIHSEHIAKLNVLRLESYQLEQEVEYIEKFETLSIFSALQFGENNLYVKNTNQSTFQRRLIWMRGTVKAISNNQRHGEPSIDPKIDCN